MEKMEIRIQELELELKAKDEEIATSRESYEKLKEDNESLRIWNQKLYSQIPVGKEEVIVEDKKEKIKAEDIRNIWAR